jgi:hypothetical protein
MVSITTFGSSPSPEGLACRWSTTGGPTCRIEAKVRLRDVLNPRKTSIDYIYDFGDCWEHRLTVTDVRAGEPGVSYPRYIGGEGNGPPEDCGGISGFYELLEVLADPKNPDHADAKKWLRPQHFRRTADQIRARPHRKPS